ncbi:LytTR family DNA-binding domain-containing protein [Mangrovibacterium marinum]|uniref:LytTR family two component transcriptional regulator n=1 Tax=Mangrovibacterium marinum TaxID=1639118 RepID=A0A2T5C2B0_9BACT|nr:LytTR family DNA-binding domain-containing protein [Mangrovibacterium marinum]PTN08839.1 LytTR family two component transcriptional regulator [Mangrovibacterium marinum]
MSEKQITAIIIDDNEDAIALLQIYLQAFHEIKLLGTSLSPRKGLKMIKKLAPDMVFLDIDMPDMNGLELGQIVLESDIKTEIVFTTAHSQYAFPALTIKPLDYLVKPFSPADLITVINRFKQKQKTEEFERKMDLLIRTKQLTPKIKLSNRNGFLLVNPDDVMLIRAEGNYCRIFLKNGKDEEVTQAFFIVADLLNSPNIVKANRSAFLNIQYITRIEKKRKVVCLTHQKFSIEEPMNRSALSYFEKLNCFPIS